MSAQYLNWYWLWTQDSSPLLYRLAVLFPNSQFNLRGVNDALRPWLTCAGPAHWQLQYRVWQIIHQSERGVRGDNTVRKQGQKHYEWLSSGIDRRVGRTQQEDKLNSSQSKLSYRMLINLSGLNTDSQYIYLYKLLTEKITVSRKSTSLKQSLKIFYWTTTSIKLYKSWILCPPRGFTFQFPSRYLVGF